MATREECLSDLADFLISIADELADVDAPEAHSAEVRG